MRTLVRRLWTDEELRGLPKAKGKFELIDGRLTKMSPANGDHSYITVLIVTALQSFVGPRRLGMVFESSAGFRVDSANVLSPDVAYASFQRIREGNTHLSQFIKGVPELAVEVISPSERKGKIRLKMEKYFVQGTRLVWLVYPQRKIVEIYSAPDSKIIKQVGDELDGGELLPGFRLPLAEVFADWF